MELLRKPWMVDMLKAAFEGRKQDRISTLNGEVAVSRVGKKQFVQLVEVKSLDPAVVDLADTNVYVTAEITDSCISRFEKELGKPLTQFRYAVFQLERYKFVFGGSDAVLFEDRGTFQEQLEEYAGEGGGQHDGSARSSPKSPVQLRLVVESMSYQSGEGNPIIGKPKNMKKDLYIRKLMSRLPVKKHLLPAPRLEVTPNPKLPVASEEHSAKKDLEDTASDVLSQPFATQDLEVFHFSEEDDGGGDHEDEDEDGDSADESSLASQEIANESDSDGDGSMNFATQAHQALTKKYREVSSSSSSSTILSRNAADQSSLSRNKTPEEMSDDEDGDDSDPTEESTEAGISPGAEFVSFSHPGWGGIVEVPAELVAIPEDQGEVLKEPESWWPPQNAPRGPHLQMSSRLHPLRAPTVVTEAELSRQLCVASEAQPRSESESSDDEPVEWPTSPPEVRETTPDLNRPPPSSSAASSSPARAHGTEGISESALLQRPASPASPVSRSPKLPAGIEEPANGSDLKAMFNGDDLSDEEIDDDESLRDIKSTADQDYDIAAESNDIASQPAAEEAPISKSRSKSNHQTPPGDIAEPDDGDDTEHESQAPVSADAANEHPARQCTRKAAYSRARGELFKDDQAVRRRRTTTAVNGTKKPQKLAKREDAFSSGAKHAAGSTNQDGYSSTPPRARTRAPSLEPPIPVKDPFGMTPAVKYTWESDSIGESDDESESGSDSNGRGDVDSENRSKENTPSTPLTFKPVIPHTTSVGEIQQPTHDDSGEDEDIPSAPAIPLGKRIAVQEIAVNRGTVAVNHRPPSTAPNLGPVVQVKVTPYQRSNSVSNTTAVRQVAMPELRGPIGEEIIPATHDQRSSTETEEDEPERQIVSPIWSISIDSVATQESTRFGSLGEGLDGGSDSDHGVMLGTEVPRTRAVESTKHRKSPEISQQRRLKRALESAAFASQEIRDASHNIGVSSPLAEQQLGDATVEDHVGKPSPALGKPPPITKLATSTDLPRKRLKPPSVAPVAAKKARMDTTSTDRHHTPQPSSSPVQAMPRCANRPGSPPSTNGTSPDLNPASAMADEPVSSPKPPSPRKRRHSVTPSEVETLIKQTPTIPKPPKAEMYAGFRPRIIAVPGYENLDEDSKLKLEERRRLFFGTHRPVAPFVATPMEERGADEETSKGRRGLGGGNGTDSDTVKWWLDEDTPMRKFVTRYKDLKAVKRESEENG